MPRNSRARRICTPSPPATIPTSLPARMPCDEVLSAKANQPGSPLVRPSADVGTNRSLHPCARVVFPNKNTQRETRSRERQKPRVADRRGHARKSPASHDLKHGQGAKCGRRGQQQTEDFTTCCRPRDGRCGISNQEWPELVSAKIKCPTQCARGGSYVYARLKRTTRRHAARTMKKEHDQARGNAQPPCPSALRSGTPMPAFLGTHTKAPRQAQCGLHDRTTRRRRQLSPPSATQAPWCAPLARGSSDRSRSPSVPRRTSQRLSAVVSLLVPLLADAPSFGDARCPVLELRL